MARISFDNVHKTYDGGHAALAGLTLDIADGEFMVLVGPSGCGKSTSLRIIAGLEEVTGGTVSIDGRVVNDLSPRDRNIAMVFQSYALYPHLSVADNIAFGLKVRGADRAVIAQKVRETAALLEMTEYLDRKPAKLSGGQRQRVAMGRALVRSPNAFLMDEPLSNLDTRLRGQMRAEIAALQRLSRVTTVYVTHDQVEAMTMGHRVAVLHKGRLQQLGTPRDIYDHPRNLFVAGFIGTPPINFLRAVLTGSAQGAVAQVGPFTLPLAGARDAALRDSAAILGIRPEALHLAPGSAGPGTITARVTLVEDLGATLLVHADLPRGVMVPADLAGVDAGPNAAHLALRVVVPGTLRIARGDSVTLTADPAAIHVFDAQTGDALPQA